MQFSSAECRNGFPDVQVLLGYNVAQQEICAMTENSVVRARIDAATKSEAAAVLASMGLSLSDAFRLLLKRIAARRRCPSSHWCRMPKP